MAIIKDLKEIENLIPEPDYRLYGSNITQASPRDTTNNPLYAFTVSRKYNVLVNAFRVVFVLVKRQPMYYLMVYNYDKENGYSGDYITLSEPKGRKLEKTDWPFTTDVIGLRLDSTCYDKNMIYFGTSAFDANEIKELLKAKEENKVLTLKPVIV